MPAIIAIGATAVACVDDVSPHCNSDADCPHGEVCYEFLFPTCEPGCRSDADCGFNHFCPGPGGFFGPDHCVAGCASTENCPAHQFCPVETDVDEPSQCEPGCHDDGECKSGSACSTLGECEPICEPAAPRGCSQGFACVSGNGGRPDTCQSGCTTDEDCPDDSFCAPAFSGAPQCRPGCRDDSGCAAGSWCSTGVCILSRFVALALDEANVYFVKEGASDGVVASVPKEGGAPTTLASGLRRPYAVAVDHTNVYFTGGGKLAANGAATMNGALMMAPLSGGSAVTLASGLECPGALTVDGNTVYFLDRDRIMAATTGGSWAAVLATALVPVSCDLSFFGLQSQAPRNAIAVDESNVYFTSFLPLAFDFPGFFDAYGKVMKVSRNGGEPVVLAGGLSSPSNVAISAQNVYWLEAGTRTFRTGRLMRAGLEGEAATVLASVCGPVGLALDETNAYFTSACARTEVGSVPISGGPPRVLVQDDLHIATAAVATDGKDVYFTDSSDTEARVMKVPVGGGAPATVIVSSP